jgi:hypothetical protein
LFPHNFCVGQLTSTGLTTELNITKHNLNGLAGWMNECKDDVLSAKQQFSRKGHSRKKNNSKDFDIILYSELNMCKEI